MSSEENKPSNVKDVAEAVSAVAKAVPIYDDAVQPAAKQVGKGLETIAKTVNVALSPLELVVWGYDQIKDYVSESVTEKLQNTKSEDVITPKTSVAGPALEALRFAGDEESLRDMYANLLANAMDKNTALSAHPAFVEILKNLNSDEAKIMKFFASAFRVPFIDIESESENVDNSGTTPHFLKFSMIGNDSGCDHPELTPNYLDNLQRLGLIELRNDAYLTKEGAYETLLDHKTTKDWDKKLQEKNRKISITKGYAGRTNLGLQFCKACVIAKQSQA